MHNIRHERRALIEGVINLDQRRPAPIPLTVRGGIWKGGETQHSSADGQLCLSPIGTGEGDRADGPDSWDLEACMIVFSFHASLSSFLFFFISWSVCVCFLFLTRGRKDGVMQW